MANYANLLATIAANIYTNGNNEVTAAMVKTAVDQMVASLGAGYQFMGVATPATTPGNTDVKQFYIASTPGTYTNFGGVVVRAGEIWVFYYDSSWNEARIINTDTYGRLLLDSSDFEAGYYIYEANGVPQVNASYMISQFIEVQDNMRYIGEDFAGGSTVARIAFYDVSQQYIAGSSINANSFSIIPPSGAKYLRCSSTTASSPTIRTENYVLAYQKAGRNLFELGTAGYYMTSAGTIYPNPDFGITPYIPVTAGETYHLSSKNNLSLGSAGAGYGYYDSSRQFIEGHTVNVLTSVAPVGAAYLRASYALSVDSPQIIEGSSRVLYVDSSQIAGYLEDAGVVTEDNSMEALSAAASTSALAVMSSIGRDAGRAAQASLASGSSLQITTFPQALKKGHTFSVYAEFTGSFGNGLTIGYGYGNGLAGRYIKVDDTNIVLIDENEGAISTTPHGLTMSTFVKVAASAHDGKLDVAIVTFAGTYSGEIADWGFSARGIPFIRANVALSNVVFTTGNKDLKKPVWAFGDSYFAFTNTRVGYWLKEWGYLNICMQGFGGQASVDASQDLNRMLAFGCPKYLVWCLGMNDTYSTWKASYDNLVEICAGRGITLILCTIPVVRDSSYTGKEDMTTDVRASGYRYIDAYKAVGCNASGEWYGDGTANDYQSADDVHPSELGARAIASQWLVDFPEIMQYGLIGEDNI